ncbi:cyclase [Mycolicibacterium cyprinidarum]|uniref:Cyclase n=1 Tax=Mycolicibacterium cyprinidarum TaxID=2860311 RepID=A0ABQ4VH63_9MYCO|nr:cyclase [Mycolicibacterium sp. NGTWS0302]GJF16379.1 cyclase [Mycolicibacterium sp. NGTWS1803]GJF18720.1 cyclase [Mycolicibacterium sp. NGTWSNA01]
MAVRTSSDVVIEAPPAVILDALADIGSAASWSSMHKNVEVLDRYPDGKPHHVKATVKIMGISDREVLEYHWGDDWVVWDAAQTLRQRGQHGEYNLTPVGEDRTQVRFDLILDLIAPYPHFLVTRLKKMVLDVALENLRERVMHPASP